jgi:hypothetical protein
MGDAGAQLNSAYQRDGRRVQDLGAHRVHNFQLAGQAHVGDEGTQRPPLQARQRLRFGGRDGRLDAPLGLLAHVPTQVPQVVDILRVDGQLVGGRGLCRAFRMGPARLCPRTRPHDVVGVGPREIRREGHVEGQVDLRAGRDHGRGARSGRGALYRRGDGHVVVRPREREAGRGRHFFPPVPCLAGEVGYLVHSVSTTRAPDGSTGGGAGGRKSEEARRDAACASGARAARRPAFWDLELTTSDQSSAAVVQTQTRARPATPEAARLAEPPNRLRTAHSRFSRRRPGGAVAALQTGQRLLGSALSQSGIVHRQARLIPRHMSRQPESVDHDSLSPLPALQTCCLDRHAVSTHIGSQAHAVSPRTGVSQSGPGVLAASEASTQPLALGPPLHAGQQSLATTEHCKEHWNVQSFVFDLCVIEGKVS